MKGILKKGLAVSGLFLGLVIPSSIGHADQVGGWGLAPQDVAGPDQEDIVILLNPGEDPVQRASEIAEDVLANKNGLHCPGLEKNHRTPTPTPPLMHCYDAFEEFGYLGIWMQFTTSQADRFDDLYGPLPPWMRGTARAYDVSIPMLEGSVTADAPPVGPSAGGIALDFGTPEIIDNSLKRLGWRPPADRSANIGVSIAVSDTGVDAFHPDLRIAPSGGYDCTYEYPTRWQYDPHGHGTFVSGRIGAIYGNERGIAGGAPGVGIVPIPSLGTGGYGTSASVLCSIDMAYRLGAWGVNLSLGGDSPQSEVGGQDPYHDLFALASRHMLITVAAGNDRSDARGTAPANYPEVITVGAANFDGEPHHGIPNNAFAWFSNYGPLVDVIAGGVGNRSIIPEVEWTVTGSGTSFAAPDAMGVIAAYLSEHKVSREPKELTDAWNKILRHSQIWMSCAVPTVSCTGRGQYDGWPLDELNKPPVIRFGA